MKINKDLCDAMKKYWGWDKKIKDYELLNRRFTYHKPDAQKIRIHEHLREGGLEFALKMTRNIEPCRELSLALTKIEEAVMWANAAVARSGTGNNEDCRLCEDHLTEAQIQRGDSLCAKCRCSLEEHLQ